MPLTLQKTVLTPRDWDLLCQDSPQPLQQHWAYGLAATYFGGSAFQVNVMDGAQKVAFAVASHRRFFRAIRATTLFRGPNFMPGTPPDTYPAILDTLKKGHNKWRWDLLAIMPEFADTAGNRAVMRQAGLRRVMSGFSTAWLDLRPDIATLQSNLHGKWRNQLKKAEKNGLVISIGGKKESQYQWLLEKEEEQRSNRGYQATPLGLVPAFTQACSRFQQPDSTESTPVLTVTALQGREKIASGLFLLHGNSATYHIGWLGDTGRQANAQNLVLFSAVEALKQRQIRFLDLGGLNTADLAGIARFKLGMGATPFTLVGAYL